jgi:hypothetical protein
MGAPRDETDISPCAGQLHGEIAPDRTRTVNAYFHGSLVCLMFNPMSRLLLAGHVNYSAISALIFWIIARPP